MNSTASPALSYPIPSPLARREQALLAERAEVMQRADAVTNALNHIKSARCGANCLRDLARTLVMMVMIFGLPPLMLMSASYFPKGAALGAGMLLIGLGWMGASLAVRRFVFDPV